MSSLFKQDVATDILGRLEKLQADTKPAWGKMTISQMLAHCQVPLQAALGDKKFKRTFFGFVFGGIAKKKILKEGPFKKNLPTDPRFRVKDERNFEIEKHQLKALVKRFSSADSGEISREPHPFFGKLSADEWGTLMWKHLDHHLKQFNA